MGRREWERKICFRHSQWYCFHNFFLCIIPLRATLLLREKKRATLSFHTVHISHSHPLLLVLWKAMCRGGDKHYLDYLDFSPWHLLSQFIKFVFGWQWEIKHFISIIIPFYPFLLPKLPSQSYFPGLCFCATISTLGSWSRDVYSVIDIKLFNALSQLLSVLGEP